VRVKEVKSSPVVALPEEAAAAEAGGLAMLLARGVPGVPEVRLDGECWP
jgi:hypothetical protein